MLVTLLIACATLVLATAAPTDVPAGRVVGGADAVDAQFPHQVSLRYKGSHTCGGSIISRNYILTAAHCVTAEDGETGELVVTPANQLSIRAGSLDRLSNGVVINVADVIVHENYGSFLNDLALLLLESPLIYSDRIAPIQIASTDTPAGADVVISGWGRLKTNGDLPRQLQWNVLSALSNLRCQTSTLMFSSSLICLGHERNNGACNGDSGGPAVYNNEIVGIAGFVMGGCGSNLPDGYAKVFYHRDWIIKNAKL
ncbi:serine protease SP24D-like [Scaptodrosophila lebanonensis]|uniref:trypsin n=1 Tax=Drosophila lebanonensis TaxID=7225 RepID=A0A6J2TZ76_DROLE|nr:serine protease SP24D-like [Scaptodrosophila lebanonensis]